MIGGDELRAAAADLKNGRTRLRSLVLTAVAQGASRTWIFEQTGLARTTINRWIAEENRLQ